MGAGGGNQVLGHKEEVTEDARKYFVLICFQYRLEEPQERAIKSDVFSPQRATNHRSETALYTVGTRFV